MSAPEVASPGRDDVSASWWTITAILSTLALAIGIVGVFLPTGGGGGGGGSTEPKTVEISMKEFSYTPSSVDLNAGQKLIVKVTNDGTMQHDLRVQGGKVGTRMLQPGESETVELGSFEATTDAWCTVPGHKEAGMVLAINVAGAAAGGGGGAAAAPADNSAKIDPTAEPAADWVARDPALAPAPGGTVHAITLHAKDELIEVAPGVKQLMWTFGGTVPGPTLRGKVGDVFNVTLVNDGTIDHSIDFHASKVAWNVEMRSIKPGESLQYNFKADYAGAWMYHCGTAPTLHHIGNGMFGAVVIDPPDLPPVAKEFIFVQSELYLGAQGKEGDLSKMLADKWDAVVFNGYYNQYKFRPIRIETNERVRVWVVDDGPSENLSFHIVGTIFDTVYKEGHYSLRPDGSHGGSQALDLQPAQGGFVEFTTAADGFYPLVTHKFSNASKGALGLFQSGEALLSSGAGH